MFARTERLLLRPGWSEDAPALFRAIADEAIVRNLATAPWPYGLATPRPSSTRERRPPEPSLLDLPARRRRARADRRRRLRAARRDGEPIEFGYWIARPYWGRGYATEAGARVDRQRPRRRCGCRGWSPAISSTIRPRAGCCASSASGRPATPSRATAPAAAPRRRAAMFALELAGEEAAAAEPASMAA